MPTLIPILANAAAASPVEGYAYPNEQHLLWSFLIVIYPYITGLVAGSFIMGSLVRVFNVQALEPAYRLSLLISLAFLFAAPLPLMLHLGHPERSIMMMITPHFGSPMAMFGFIYAWYLTAVLLLELWFDYRKDFVRWTPKAKGLRRLIYSVFTVGVLDVSPNALKLDARMSRLISIIGIPSAFILTGYAGFIFGSIKANPWWSNVLIPIIFIFSAIVSGFALCVFLYMVINWLRRRPLSMDCLDAMGKFLFFALVVDATIEGLDWLHRLYAADESIHVLKTLAVGNLFHSLLVIQTLAGTLVPLVILVATQLFRKHIAPRTRRFIYFLSSVLIMIGVLAMRYNIVIGGQMFSKSLLGFIDHKLQLGGHEGILLAAAVLCLPLLVLWALIKIFMPSDEPQTNPAPA